MSDPVSKAEIEDVLSSIRRLVSEDVMPPAERSAAEISPDQPESITGRLVLTPALRVGPDGEGDADTDRSAARDDVISATPMTMESATAAPFRLEQPMGIVREERAEEPGQVGPEVPEAPEAPEAPGDIVEPESTGAKERTPQELADTGAQTASDDSDKIPDLPSQDRHRTQAVAESSDGETRTPEYAANDDAADLNFADLAEAPIAGFESAASPEDVPEFRALEDRVAHMEAAVSAQNTDWEPDGSEPDQETPDAMPRSFSFSSSRSDAPQDDAEADGLSIADAGISTDTVAEEPAEEPQEPEDQAGQSYSTVTLLHPQSHQLPTAPAGQYPDAVAELTPGAEAEPEAEPEPMPENLAGSDAGVEAGSEAVFVLRNLNPDEEETAANRTADRSEDTATTEAGMTADTGPDIYADIDEAIEADLDRPAAYSPGDGPADGGTDTGEGRGNRDDPAPADAAESAGSSENPENPEDLVLDEAALRNLIAEVVRDELKGGLGEKITRNVRKMVRREILRTLTAQECD